MNNEELSQLILKYLRGSLSDEEYEKLNNWKHESAENGALFEELTDTDRISEQLRQLYLVRNEIDQRLEAAGIPIKRPAPVVSFWRKRWAAAVAILLALGLGLVGVNHKETVRDTVTSKIEKSEILPGTDKAVLTLANGETIALDHTSKQVIQQDGTDIYQEGGRLSYHSRDELQVGFNTLSTPRGGQFSVILPDGSKVFLNAASSIQYPTVFDENQREVKLTGEAYFEIAPLYSKGKSDKKIPFLVRSGAVTVEVLGTHFNINAYGDEGSVRTTLLEGIVTVSSHHQTTILNPGQQATTAANGDVRVKKANIDQIMAWRSGYFEFDEMQLPAILRQLSRWYDVDFVDRSDGHTKAFGGRISKSLKLSEVLEALGTFGVTFSIQGRTVIVNDGR